jgi:hypothetical protein
VLPLNVKSPAAAMPTGAAGPGGKLRLPSLRGRLLDGELKTPIVRSSVYIVGNSWRRYESDENGRFEISNLLPGTYELEIQSPGYPTFRRDLVIGEEDVTLELTPP